MMCYANFWSKGFLFFYQAELEETEETYFCNFAPEHNNDHKHIYGVLKKELIQSSKETRHDVYKEKDVPLKPDKKEIKDYI